MIKKRPDRKKSPSKENSGQRKIIPIENVTNQNSVRQN
jgi:hypothetical protein